MSVKQARRWLGLGLVVFVICSQQLSAAGTNIPGLKIWVREASGNDYEVSVPIPAGQAIDFQSSEDCGTAAHKTAAGNKFAHAHLSFSLPITGVSTLSATHQVTTTNIDRYHKAHMFASSRYTVVATANQQQYNCHGYALGFNVWIDDPAKIFDDDYEPGSKSDSTPLMNRTSGHMVKVTGISGSVFKYIRQTHEKNNYSKVHKGTWGYLYNRYPDSLSLYKKK